MTQASRDENRIPTLLGVSSADGTTPVPLFADPTTHRLYVDLAAGGTTTVDAGTTTTLAPGASATVVNSGTTTDAVFDFGIPAGEKGDPGDPGPTGPVGMVWKDAYVGATAYVVNDAVSYNGSSYICILNSTGNLPTDTTYWSLVAQKGSDGLGTGDMLASVYDPKSVGGNAFDMDNMVEGTNNKLVSSAEKTAWNDKLDDITGESIADLSDVDSISGITDGKVLKWDTNKFVVADDDDTTYTASDFDIKDLTDSNNLRTTWNGKVDKSLFDANTILYATTDDTPVALTIPEQTIVGRKTSGNIEALAIDSDLSSVSANDDTVPSAKATKTALDLKAPSASPTFTGTVTLPKTLEIQDTSADHQYVLGVNELTADRTVTLPLLTGNDEFVFKDHAQTLTNKRITPRITTITSHATPTINTDNCDAVTITAQAEAITSMTTNLSGTPTNFQKLIIRIKDDGAARAITWGDSFEAKGVALPTTTVISKVLTVGFIYDTVTSKWGCVASSQEA